MSKAHPIVAKVLAVRINLLRSVEFSGFRGSKYTLLHFYFEQCSNSIVTFEGNLFKSSKNEISKRHPEVKEGFLNFSPGGRIPVVWT